jgi:hypothetical protein
MADYSYGQLEELWIRAGGSRALAPLMAAIALAESGGNPAANNYTDNGGAQTSWGLWQVSNGTHSWPGSQDPNEPLANARYAVAKYRAQGLGAWGTYDSGAYRQYYKGSVPPSQLPPGGGKGGGGGGQDAILTSWNPGDLQWLEGPQGIMQAIGGLFAQEATGQAGGVDALAKGFTVLTGLLSSLVKSFEWFFVPSHWVRMIAASAGVLFLIPGLYAMMRASQGGYGDVTLALAILLVTVSGVLFFIAFHNLPDDVRNLQELLRWMSDSIRQGRAAATSGTTVQTA